ncbi:MAG: BCD family MFS transporter [Chloroflexi bacterium]|jgi:MFS transporter, BCD family, chlorophyll transporter|nr:BCD family MFS transporter [Chloroflexota bacterium]
MLRKQIQLGLLHVAVTITLLPINSTLNRVMIKELAISATLVAILASLPYIISPIQVYIGAYSDKKHLFGFRRTPAILLGLILCVLGVVLSPATAFSMAENLGQGILMGILSFGAWGMGYNLAAVSYLSLASELSGEKGRGKTIAIMWFMMIVSIILTSIILSNMVDPYTPQALVRAFRWVGFVALLIGLVGLIRLEQRDHYRASNEERYSWGLMTRTILSNPQASRFFWYLILLLTAILGQDILLEPFAGEAFGMSVTETTRITSIWGVFALIALLLTGWLESRLPKKTIAAFGGWIILTGFVLITISGILLQSSVFYIGLILLGAGTGISTVSNLSLMLDMTVEGQVGLFIGAWGMANAISRLTGSLLGGALRDVTRLLTNQPVLGYLLVFGLMALMVLVTLMMLTRINVADFQKQAQSLPVIERAVLAGDA